VVAVPGLVPDDVFFEHLSERRFPAGNFIRAADQLDYLEEPDVFHDVFGHVPLLAQQAVADFMQALGLPGRAGDGDRPLHRLARLYWYTVEFGLARERGRSRSTAPASCRASASPTTRWRAPSRTGWRST
jgi:phenylalanine-4-hydroxylase